MCRAIDVANFFIDLANSDPDDCMTNLRVNKLLYFAQAWSLVRRGKPLFPDELQAWKFGPVVPSVYQAFKPCGRERISSVSGEYSADVFSTEELELLIDVARKYGRYTSPALVDMTHRPGSPWEAVYAPGQNNTISTDCLKAYYSQKALLPAYEVPEAPEDQYIGHRDPSDGLLVLPKEYDNA